ncbi:MAG: hypothetical protein RI924_725 [Bacteroidota bacterium]|jgi:hypothetical protein
MIHLHPKSDVYVVCPANSATGGPELLHQLAFKLRCMGVRASMYYFNAATEYPVHPNYRSYAVPFVKTIENLPEHWIIFPETALNHLSNKAWNRLQKVIWWLSIDNYFLKVKQSKKSILSQINAYLHGKQGALSMPSLAELFQQDHLYHLAQSAYAIDFLNQKGFQNTAYLSDYLNPVFLEESGKIDLNKKKDQVLYNPKKGFEFTQKLMAAAPELNWIALENMTPKQVADTLAESKVYIDFGQHPGKDRFPREAAVMGCCVITGKRGSAAFEEDLHLPKGFKFDDAEAEIPNILAKITCCLTDFDRQQSQFADYIEKIKLEESKFDEDLKNLFK